MPRGRRAAAPPRPLRVRVHLGEDPFLYSPFDDVEARQRYLAAEQQAKALLRECLTPEEWDQLTRLGYLDVASSSTPGRRYLIPGSGGRPIMYEGERAMAHLCVVPTEWLPRADVILLHLVMLRANEEHYLATANHFPA